MRPDRTNAAILAVVAVVAITGCADPGRITPTGEPEAVTTSTRPPSPSTSSDDESAPSATTVGASDAGDPLTPGAGNGGYDVRRYDLDISVADDRSTIDATVDITAEATQVLDEFHLDLHALEVSAVELRSGDDEPDDAEVVEFRQDGDELIITPDDPIEQGASFVTTVIYGGAPQPVADPTAPGTIGWLSAPSGTFVAAETTGAKSFLPSNDHPSDKAVFSIAVEAANADTVVANGTLTSKEPAGEGRTRWVYDQTDPMATYLVQIAVGDYEIVESVGPRGIPIRHAIVRSVTAEERVVLDDTGPQLEYFETVFGPYPLDNYGLLVADSSPDFALETQTLTLLPTSWLSDSPESTSIVMAHELAHQWFGDAVSPKRWADIWLNEGFATYGEWLWADHQGWVPLDASVDETMLQAVRWREAFGPVTDPAPELLFSPNQYGGAGLVLHALRLTVGDEPFFTILRTWATDQDGRSATTADFEALAARIAGRDLTSFFDAWLRSSTLPSMPA